jgi:PKD repeat protein
MINESSTAPAAGAAGWSASVPATYAAATAGAHTLYAWAKDAAGNVSTSLNASTTITLPVLTDFSATPTSGLAPLAVTFSDLSSSTPSSWSWSFGDGATSTLQNPSHTYTATGNYTVALTATGTGGPVTVTKTAYISVIPCGSLPVKIGGTLSYYPTIQSAYDAAITGNIVQIQGQVLSGPLSLLGNATVELQGGFSCDFFTNPGYTTITGPITIGGGTTVIVENIVII